MQKLEFTNEEMEVLRDLLQHYIDEMDIEVSRTDTRTFKAMLKHRRELVEEVLGKINNTVNA